MRQSGENRAEDLPVSFAGDLRVIAEDEASAFEFLRTPSVLSRCIHFLRLCFGLLFFVSFTLFSEQSLCSLSVSFVFVVLGQYW